MVDSAINMSNVNDNESYLTDDKPVLTPQFKGATLEIDSAANNADDPNVVVKPATTSNISIVSEEMGGGDFNRDRSGSTMSRASKISTASRTSLSTNNNSN